MTIDYPKNAPVLKQCYWDDLKTQVEQRLKKANLNVSSAEKVRSETDVGLIVRIELLKVPDANLFAVRVETVMARQMLLATGSDMVFIIPIPLSTHGIRLVSHEDLPDVIEKVVCWHIDQFLQPGQTSEMHSSYIPKYPEGDYRRAPASPRLHSGTTAPRPHTRSQGLRPEIPVRAAGTDRLVDDLAFVPRNRSQLAQR